MGDGRRAPVLERMAYKPQEQGAEARGDLGRVGRRDIGPVDRRMRQSERGCRLFVREEFRNEFFEGRVICCDVFARIDLQGWRRPNI